VGFGKSELSKQALGCLPFVSGSIVSRHASVN
jgi:hypothetical protein